MVSQKEFLEKKDIPPNPEMDYQTDLENKLRVNAKNKIKNSLDRATNSINFIVEGVLPDTNPSLEHDQSFSFSTLLILKKIGLLDELIKTQSGDKQELKIKDISVVINRFSKTGFSLAFSSVKGLEEKKESLLQELKSTPFWQLFVEAVQLHSPGGKTSINTESFRFQDDPVVNAALFSRLNILEGGFNLSACQSQEFLEELAKKSLFDSCLKHLSLDSLGNLKSINFSLDEGIVLSLLPIDERVTEDDLLVANWKVQISSQIEQQMMEVANQNSQSRCEAFIKRPTGHALIEALKHAKLKFSPDFEKFLIMDKTSTFSDRYGGAYTHISRLLAKILWSRRIEKITNVFVNQKNNQPSLEELNLLADYPSTDSGLSSLQNILKQLLDRDIDDNNSDISVLPTKIDVSDGACFDVSTYYCQALNYGQLYLKLINGKPFLLKTHGARTLINLQPIWFNGISLPKGSLFTMTDENEFAFLRLTPFMFENREDMISAFGTEVIKTEDNGEDLLMVANYSW